MRAFALGIAATGIALLSASAQDGTPFSAKVITQAFELSKSCSKECSNETVSLVRLPLPQGKVGFLVTTTDQEFCGSGGCQSIVIVVAGNKFIVVKEGQGISESEALLVASGQSPQSNSEPSYYVANTKPPDAFLSLRTEPSIAVGRRIAQLPNGTELKVLMKRPDRWWKVRLIATGQEGWVLSGQGSLTWIECCKTAAAVIPLAPGKPGTAAAAAPLPLLGNDPPEARDVLRALEEIFPISEFCRKRPIKVIKLGNDEWASVTFFDNNTCRGRGDGLPYNVYLTRAQADMWIIKCKDQFSDLPGHDHYFKVCGGMPREMYAALFGVALPNQMDKTAAQTAHSPAEAFEGIKSTIDCKNTNFPGDLIIVDPNSRADRNIFVDQARLTAMLNHLRGLAREKCGDPVRRRDFLNQPLPEKYTVIVGTLEPSRYSYGFRAEFNGKEGWRILQNPVADEIRAAQQQQAAQRLREHTKNSIPTCPPNPSAPDIMCVRLGAKTDDLPPEFKRLPIVPSKGVRGAMEMARCFPGLNPILPGPIDPLSGQRFASQTPLFGDACIVILYTGPQAGAESGKVFAVYLQNFPLGTFKFLDNAVDILREKFGNPSATNNEKGGALANLNKVVSINLAWGTPNNFFDAFIARSPESVFQFLYDSPLSRAVSDLKRLALATVGYSTMYPGAELENYVGLWAALIDVPLARANRDSFTAKIELDRRRDQEAERQRMQKPKF